MWHERKRLEALTRSNLSGLLPLSLSLTLKLLASVVAMLAIVAAPTTLSNIGNGTSGRKCLSASEEFK